MLRDQIEDIINNKTKPLGSLGLLEEVALQVALVQNTSKPSVRLPHIVVFAADHGIAETGLVNPYPQAVTAQMVKNFLAGGAAINVFCRQNNIALTIIDAGVKSEWTRAEMKHKNFVVKKMGRGTKNYLHEPAMSKEVCTAAIGTGREVVQEIVGTGCNTVGFGEMGISNTSSASLIMSSILGIPVEQCTGKGTGANPGQLHTKIATLQQVAALHRIHQLKSAPEALLAAIGGFEIAMMCGAFLEAAEQAMVILVDGFIATAALLLACAIEPGVLKNCLFAHCSHEAGHQKMLDYLGAKPLLHLGLRLGEGTGAALALPVVQSAVNFLNEMASFASAGIDQSSP